MMDPAKKYYSGSCATHRSSFCPLRDPLSTIIELNEGINNAVVARRIRGMKSEQFSLL